MRANLHTRNNVYFEHEQDLPSRTTGRPRTKIRVVTTLKDPNYPRQNYLVCYLIMFVVAQAYSLSYTDFNSNCHALAAFELLSFFLKIQDQMIDDRGQVASDHG